MVDNKVKLSRMTNFIIDDKEQYTYHLEQNRLETFSVVAVRYRDSGIAPTLPQLDIDVATIILGEVTYTNIRKNIYIYSTCMSRTRHLRN